MARPPEYIDLQVNGYMGVDLNADDLSAEGLHAACEHLRRDGVAGILATIVTAGLDDMAARLARIAAYREADALVREVIWGLHVEGPFISPLPGYVGAHPPEHVRPAEADAMRRLLDAAAGLTRLVTLAPEHDAGLAVTRLLAGRGILVSAGHCDPSLDQLRAALDAGLTMFTHLGNGCPMMLPRHDNIIQRALCLSERLTLMFIADGVHVPYPALGNYLRVAGMERTVVVTDAISAAGLGPGRFTIGARAVEVGEDLVARGPGNSYLVGSTATMPRMARALAAEIGLSARDVRRLTSANPRRALGIGV